MTISEIIDRRGILEVLHFTTNSGLTGILATGMLKARTHLLDEKYLERILKQNCPNRSGDSYWHDHVNLSISRINTELFGISEGYWHRNLDGWWCILSFHPEILTHAGVVFTTTNNIYPSVLRGTGSAGLEAMFAPIVYGKYRKKIYRSENQPEFQSTCPQAEVLYPIELSINYLQRIYVRENEHADAAHGIVGALSICTAIEILVCPEYFV